jgi:hypothetical protein
MMREATMIPRQKDTVLAGSTRALTGSPGTAGMAARRTEQVGQGCSRVVVQTPTAALALPVFDGKGFSNSRQ